jgi:hypothetical protein
MGAINRNNWFVLPDPVTQDFLIPYCLSLAPIPVTQQDACYFAGTVAPANGAAGDVAYPADKFPSLGSEPLDQISFAKLFIGYSQDQILYSEVNLFKRFVIRTDGVMSATCPSQTWKHGDLVGIYSNGTALDPQQVDKVTQPIMAFGVCIKDQATPSSRVTFRFSSRWCDEVVDSLQYASTGEVQNMQNANVLNDANQVFAVNSPFFSQQQNTAARTIMLPLEAASIKLQFWVHNLAASTGTITFLGSKGGVALGTAVIPVGKFGFAFCDGLNWYTSISS